jgi:hypothetical protein
MVMYYRVFAANNGDSPDSPEGAGNQNISCQSQCLKSASLGEFHLIPLSETLCSLIIRIKSTSKQCQDVEDGPHQGVPPPLS